MIRKILALMLALTVVLCMMPASALAEDGWWNILLLGGDARSEKRFERTDGMIILSINLEKNQVKMTSLMRDTYLQFPGYKNKHKLNAANVYGGPELTMSVINESFGTDIDQYVMINMVGLTKAIDMLGGVEMTIDDTEMFYINYYAKEYEQSYEGETKLKEFGENIHLNGLQAMSYTRNRYSDNDFGRVQRQQKVLIAMAKKLQQVDMSQLMNTVIALSEMVETNLTMADMLSIAQMGLKLDLESITQFRLPADGAYTSATLQDGDYVINPNLEKNTQLLHAFIYGE